jgi:hypothetical protein
VNKSWNAQSISKNQKNYYGNPENVNDPRNPPILYFKMLNF